MLIDKNAGIYIGYNTDIYRFMGKVFIDIYTTIQVYFSLMYL